jgi:hypothetical protein
VASVAAREAVRPGGREERIRAFDLGRDIERAELGLPPKYSEYFIEKPTDLRAVKRIS